MTAATIYWLAVCHTTNCCGESILVVPMTGILCRYRYELPRRSRSGSLVRRPNAGRTRHAGEAGGQPKIVLEPFRGAALNAAMRGRGQGVEDASVRAVRRLG